MYSDHMREQPVEDYLVAQVKELRGRCVKLKPLGVVGIPDRLVILRGIMIFVELKRPKGGTLSAAQKLWRRWLEDAEIPVVVLSSKGEIDGFIQRYQHHRLGD